MLTLGMFVPGWQELLILLAIGLLIFGSRLPQTARSVGSAVVEFRKGLSGDAPTEAARSDGQGSNPRASAAPQLGSDKRQA